MKTDKHELCVYCRVNPGIEGDHVPPRAFFVKYPPQLKKIPACSDCNRGASDDEQYVRDFLVTLPRVQEHPAARILFSGEHGLLGGGKVSRSLLRKQGHSLLQRIEAQTRSVDLWSAGGIYLGSQLIRDIERYRLNRVLEKMVAGLYYRHTGLLIPNDYCFNTRSGIKPESLNHTVFTPFLENGFIRLGEGEVSYTYLTASEDPATTIWLVVLYDTVFSLLYIVGPSIPPPLI